MKKGDLVRVTQEGWKSRGPDRPSFFLKRGTLGLITEVSIGPQGDIYRVYIQEAELKVVMVPQHIRVIKKRAKIQEG